MTPERREVIKAAAVAGLGLAVVGAVGFGLAAVLPGAVAPRTAARTAGGGEQGETSGRLVFRQHCARCHGIQAQGRAAFPPLANVGLGRGVVEMVVRAGIPPLMPAFGNRLRADQIQAVAEYVASLNPDTSPGAAPTRGPEGRQDPDRGTGPGGAPGDAAARQPGGVETEMAGRLVFRRNCASCHGLQAEGRGAAPPLANVGLGPGEVEAAVRGGIPPLMPSFGGRLPADQIRAVADYVASLNRGRGAGPGWGETGAPAAARQPGTGRGRAGGMGCPCPMMGQRN
ncbi:MAG: c-type cytochrome [Gemmataceae bacterium]|nr:c-type cytochrome [Gemmataceae bacterium]